MIKMLMGSIRQYKRESLLSPLFVALEVVLECLLPLVMASMIDNMTGNSMAPIIKYGIICFSKFKIFPSRILIHFPRLPW